MSDYRDLDWEMFTGHMFSKEELDKIYEQARADAIDECIKVISKADVDIEPSAYILIKAMEQLKEQNNVRE